jgi:hypothetical protein
VAVFAQEASAAAQVRHLIDRCVRVAKAVNGPSVLILPKDVQDRTTKSRPSQFSKACSMPNRLAFPTKWESAMDDGKQAEPQPDIEAADEPGNKPDSIAEGVSNLVGSITNLVKEAATVVVDAAKPSPSVSNRVETAVPPVEENYDAPPMTADELAEHAAADTQPAAKAKRLKRKKAAVAKKAAPKKAAPKKAAKQATKAPKKSAARKAGKKNAKKTTATKSASKKKSATRKAAKKTARKVAKKKKKSKK